MCLQKKLLIAVSLFFCLLGASSGYAASWNHISSYDFHEVEVGASKHANVTVKNITDQVVKIIVKLDDNPNFICFPEPLSIMTISANASINIDIGFIPNSVGEKSTGLIITDGTPFNTSQMTFYGTGIEPIPQVKIEDIIEFFDSSVYGGQIVAAKTLIKSSFFISKNQFEINEDAKRGYSDQNQLNAFRNMLMSASNEIEEENFVEACYQLSEVYNKTDGEEPPASAPDFVNGEAKPKLARMIMTLIQQLGCD